MKKIKYLVTGFLFLSSLSLFAQNDKTLIEKQVDNLISDWNTHKFQNMDSYTTVDVEWVNIVGMWWKGRTEVKMAHQNIFDAMFKNVPFTKKILNISLLTSDVAIANLVCHVGEFFPPDGIDRGNNKMPEADNLLTLIYLKKDGNWLLRSGQNTVIDSRAAQNNPVK